MSGAAFNNAIMVEDEQTRTSKPKYNVVIHGMRFVKHQLACD